jgi:hypothetical protein
MDGTTSWTKTAPQWSNALYKIWVEVADNAGNKQQYSIPAAGGFEFRYDNNAPETAITDPHENQVLAPAGATWQIAGTASDTLAGTTASQIRIELGRLQGTNTYYWDGANWFLNTEKDFAASSFVGSVWRYNMPAANLISDQRYFIKVRADDNSIPPNSSAFATVPGARFVDVVVDTTPPVSAVTFPLEGKYYKAAALTGLQGSANGDLSGISRVEVEVRRLDTGWTVVRPFAAADITGAYGTITWSSAIPAGFWTNNKRYGVESKAYDLAGSTQIVVSSVTFIVDDNAPSVAVTIPADNSNWAYLGVTSGTFSDSESFVSTVTVAVRLVAIVHETAVGPAAMQRSLRIFGRKSWRGRRSSARPPASCPRRARRDRCGLAASRRASAASP